MRKKLIFIIFIAFLIRLINLNQSLWLDEAIVAKVIRTIPLHLIPIQFSPGDFHPPFYYLFMSFWTRIFGFSEIALRMSSVVSSLLAGLMVYRIGLILSNKKTALWAMIFFLFNPLIIYYSQEARMYMMTTFFLTSTLFFFVEIVKHKDNGQLNSKSQIANPKQILNLKPQKLTIILFVLFIVLSIFTFYGSLFFAGAMLIYALIQKKYKIAFILLFTVSFSLILLSPLLYQQFQTAKTGLIDVKNWSLVLGKANIKNLFMIFVKFTSGRLSWDPKWSYYLLSGSWFLVVGSFVFLGMKKSRLLNYLFVLPLFFAFVISFFIPMLQYFRFLFLIPVMSILLAEGIGAVRSNFNLNSRLFNIILFFYFAFSFVYLLNPAFHREDWKNLSQSIKTSKPVYMIISSSDPVTYYRNDIILKELRTVAQQKQIEENIYVIPYVVEIYGFDYKKELTERGCVLSKQTSFRELILEEWSCGYIAMIQ